MKRSTQDLKAGFINDGYRVLYIEEYDGFRGITAESKTAENAGTGKTKRAYYIEGTPFAMGWLIGKMAEEAVSEMALDFTANCLPAFANPKLIPVRFQFVFKWLVDLIDKLDRKMMPDIPHYQVAEMKGLVAGCKAANPDTKVDFSHVFTLNVAIDYLTSILYAPNQLLDHHELKADDFHAPVACNAFAVFGNATVDRVHYFGRDFMFPSSGVFQKYACHIVRNPTLADDEALCSVSVTAPGWVGSIASMNTQGVAAGVDMVPSGAVNHARPGFNSTGLVRDTIQYCDSATSVIKRMVGTPRGASWLYTVADAKNDMAAVVEGGLTTEDLNALQYPPEKLKKKGLLPTDSQLIEHENTPEQLGLMVRWSNYKFPEWFLSLNDGLFGDQDMPYYAGIFSEYGEPGKNVNGPDFPFSHYFTPTLLPNDDTVCTTNLYVIPTMRLTSMDPWTRFIADSHWNDCQWRYGALSWLINENYGKIDKVMAQKIISYLEPTGFFPDYYGEDNKPVKDWKNQVINGSTSLFDLTNQTVTSHWGHFGDAWVGITLANYVP